MEVKIEKRELNGFFKQEVILRDGENAFKYYITQKDFIFRSHAKVNGNKFSREVGLSGLSWKKVGRGRTRQEEKTLSDLRNADLKVLEFCGLHYFGHA